jgi:hypothetical protein
MRLRQPGDIDRVLKMLADLQSRLMNYRGHEDTVPYLAWCAEASRQLRDHFASVDLAELAERDQRELTFSGAVMTRPREFLDRNIDLWQLRLAQVQTALEKLRPFIERPGSLLLLDTSALIEGNYFTELDWHGLAGVQAGTPVRLIVPIIVIDELDDLKRDRRAGDRARSVLHRLWELGDGSGMASAELKGRRGVAIEVLLDDPHHQRLPDNDAEIIDRAVYVSELTGRNVTIVAGDYGMLYRAAAVSLGTALVPRRPRDGAPDSPEPVGSPPADLPENLR